MKNNIIKLCFLAVFATLVSSCGSISLSDSALSLIVSDSPSNSELSSETSSADQSNVASSESILISSETSISESTSEYIDYIDDLNQGFDGDFPMLYSPTDEEIAYGGYIKNKTEISDNYSLSNEAGTVNYYASKYQEELCLTSYFLSKENQDVVTRLNRVRIPNSIFGVTIGSDILLLGNSIPEYYKEYNSVVLSQSNIHLYYADDIYISVFGAEEVEFLSITISSFSVSEVISYIVDKYNSLTTL